MIRGGFGLGTIVVHLEGILDIGLFPANLDLKNMTSGYMIMNCNGVRQSRSTGMEYELFEFPNPDSYLGGIWMKVFLN